MTKDLFIPNNYSIKVNGRLLDLGAPKVMGILNLTPDSFYKGSRVDGEKALLLKAENMLDNGADILDLGAMSSRPGSKIINPEEEQKRLLPNLKALLLAFPEAIVSIDTVWSSTARLSVDLGAAIINDISTGDIDPEMFATVANLKVPYIIMHMRGKPDDMQSNTEYEDVFNEVIDYLARKLAKLRELGVNDVIVDPGFGFGKNVEQNYQLLSQLNLFEKLLRVPVLAGLSRKSMLNKVIEGNQDESLAATIAANTLALYNGAHILRVHDVKEAVDAIKIWMVYSAG